MRSIFTLGITSLLLTSAVSQAALPTNYDALTAGEKQSILWNQILDTPYDHLPTSDPSLSLWHLFVSSFLQTSFTHTSDEMPVGRPKLIHTYGTVAQVELIMNVPASKYTGIFRSGGIGLARLSLAKQAGSFTPGMGLKILVDQQPSVNFQVMYSLDGQGDDRNMFENKFTNVVEAPKSFILKPLGIAFENAVQALSGNPKDKPASALVLPLYEAAEVNSNGTLVAQSEVVVEPSVFVFTPTAELKNGYASKVGEDFRVALGEIAEGTVLYTVSVKDKFSSAEEVIGRLVLRSQFVASEYGDSKLFFQHQRHRQ
jgi:hypothetical protein